MGPIRPGHSLNKQPGVNHISAMAQSEGGHHHHSSKTKDKVYNMSVPLDINLSFDT